jgi:hypothetical protein
LIQLLKVEGPDELAAIAVKVHKDLDKIMGEIKESRHHRQSNGG